MSCETFGLENNACEDGHFVRRTQEMYRLRCDGGRGTLSHGGAWKREHWR